MRYFYLTLIVNICRYDPRSTYHNPRYYRCERSKVIPEIFAVSRQKAKVVYFFFRRYETGVQVVLIRIIWFGGHRTLSLVLRSLRLTRQSWYARGCVPPIAFAYGTSTGVNQRQLIDRATRVGQSRLTQWWPRATD